MIPDPVGSESISWRFIRFIKLSDFFSVLFVMGNERLWLIIKVTNMGIVPSRIETKIPRTIIREGPGLKRKILADKPARESSTKASSNLNQKRAATDESAGI